MLVQILNCTLVQNAGHTYSKRLRMTNLGQEGQASYIYSLGSNLRNLTKKETKG